MSTGLQSYVGFAEEVTWGTYVAPTKFLPASASGFTFDQEVLKSAGIVTGLVVQDESQVADGNETVSGRISYPLYRGDDLALLLEHALGTTNGNGSVATPNSYWPTSMKGKGLSITIGKPQTSGTVSVVGYTGCKIVSWSISIQPGSIATIDFEFVGSATSTQSAPTVSTDLPAVYTGAHCALTIAAGARSVESLTISGTGGLDVNRRFLGSNVIAEPLTIEDRVFMLEPTVEFASQTDLDTYLANPTAQAIIATLTAGDDILRFTANGILQGGGDPEIRGKGRLVQPLKFECFASLPNVLNAGSAFFVEQWDSTVAS